MNIDEYKELRREEMRRLGGIKTERKAAASRENGKKGGRPPKQKKID